MNQMNYSRHKGSLIVLFMTIALTIYFIFLTRNSRVLIDVWPLEGIFWETAITIIVLTLLSYLLFRNLSLIIFSLSIQAFLVILIPVLKYPNALNIIGPWDCVAHYSFAKWIVETGYVDTAGNLYYWDQYGHHPGNGVLPAVLSIVSSISLGWSMNIVLSAVYLGYILFLMTTLKRFGLPGLKNTKINTILWLTTSFAISIYFFDYYGGVELGYIYTGFILYLHLKQLIKKDDAFSRNIVLVFIAFLGLLSTHLSTSVILVFYFFVVTTVLLALELFCRKPGTTLFSRKALVLFVLTLPIFIIYEFYVDIFLFGMLVRQGFRHIWSLYIKELKVTHLATNLIGLSLVELILYLINTHTKTIVVLVITLLHTIVLLLKRKILSEDEKLLTLLLVTSYSSWIVGWAGVGSFITGQRAIALISFLLSLSIAVTYEKFYGFVTRKISTLIMSIVLLVFAFSSNFGLPFQPIVKTESEVYTFSTFPQGGFSDYALHPIIYVSLYAHDTPFLCLEPNTYFGLCDLIWYSPTIPKHGPLKADVVSIDFIFEQIRRHLGKNIIIPQPVRDSILPGRIGYRGLFEKPFNFLIENGKALVYNNGLYTLFLS